MAEEAPDYHKEQLKKSSLIPTKINRRAWISNSLKFAYLDFLLNNVVWIGGHNNGG